MNRPDDAPRSNRSSHLGSTTGAPPRTRAIELLERVLAANGDHVDELAQTLMTAVDTLDSYRTRLVPMSLEHQLLLAAYAVEHEPTCARLAHRLRGQIRATISFARHETLTHGEPPPSHHWENC
jgi:hypothetical protein